MKKNIDYLLLASTSAARRYLLQQYKIPHQSAKSGVSEDTIGGNNPKSVAKNRAITKALSLSKQHPQALILGCDQTAEIHGNLITKARTPDEAEAIMGRLSGQQHHLHSAFALAHDDHIVAQGLVTVPMVMRDLTSQEQTEYLKTREWEGCVGGYRIEGLGMQLFEQVGEYTAIMGLPIPELFKALRTLGINLLTKPKGPWEATLKNHDL